MVRHQELRRLLRLDRRRTPGAYSAPEQFVLEPAAGVAPSGKPPVRIFVGTAPAQFRVERVFVWSIVKHRDPARRYEIFLMKDLVGFDSDSTFYRYAVPTLAGGKGKAIYNDVDHIYLDDPAEMFDLEMHGKGQLGIDERETSVMLLDCERMSSIWRYADAQSGGEHAKFRAVVHARDLWGPLPGTWNGRDGAHVGGTSKLLHFFTSETKPWRLLPRRRRNEPPPFGEEWHALEGEADAAGFTTFTKDQPSRRFTELLALNQEMHEYGPRKGSKSAADTFAGQSLRDHVSRISMLVRECRARTILDYGSGKARLYEPFPGEAAESRFKTMQAWDGAKVTCYDPGYAPFSGPIEAQYDGVITTDVLEHIAHDDIPWVLDELFGHAGRFVFAVAASFLACKVLPNGENAHVTLQPATWWHEHMQAASRRHPGIQWVLVVQRKRRSVLLPRSIIFRGKTDGGMAVGIHPRGNPEDRRAGIVRSPIQSPKARY